MGTRSLTVIQDAGEPIAVLYRQMDGYPTGHGKELKDFAEGMVIINGIGGNLPAKAANGMRCFAAQLVAHFKLDIGGFYLYPPSATHCGQDYVYVIDKSEGDDKLILTVLGYRGRVEYAGYLNDFDPEKVEGNEGDPIILSPFVADDLTVKGANGHVAPGAMMYLPSLSKRYNS